MSWNEENDERNLLNSTALSGLSSPKKTASLSAVSRLAGSEEGFSLPKGEAFSDGDSMLEFSRQKQN